MGFAESIAEAAAAKQKSRNSRQSITDQVAVGILLFVAVLAIFVAFGKHGMTDCKYSLLVSENLLRNHSFAIDERSMPKRSPFENPEIRADGYPYQMEVSHGKLLYGYPVGSSILSLPFVVFMNFAGVSVHKPNGSYNEAGELAIQRAIAALLMAILTVIFYRTALLLLPMSWSVVLALGGTFSTQIWSTASRVLWSHTWELLLIGLAVFLLLDEEERQVRGQPMILATLLSWAYFVRPTSSIPIMAISAYVLFIRRAEFAAFAITGAAWMLVFLVYSSKVFAEPLPGYYLFHLSSGHLWEALAGNLISPSRGLFIYVPGTAFVLLMVIRYWRVLSHQPLVFLSLSVIAIHIFVVSTDPNWWGGHCYGARLTIDTIPWFFLLAVLSSKYLRAERQSTFKHFVIAFGLLTLIVGAAMNGRGALSQSASDWVNGPPRDVDQMPSRVWDWSHPQFLADLQNTKTAAVV